MSHFPNKNYFTMPNEIFSFGLDASEILSPVSRKPQHLSTLAELHHNRQCRWPCKEYGHAVRRCARGERPHLH